jgi:hypothetical protein
MRASRFPLGRRRLGEMLDFRDSVGIGFPGDFFADPRHARQENVEPSAIGGDDMHKDQFP